MAVTAIFDAYIINNNFSTVGCEVPIYCNQYTVGEYGYFVLASNVFSNGCDGYYEIGTKINQKATIAHEDSDWIKLLHVQNGNNDYWLDTTIEELLTACKCLPTNFTVVVDNGDGTFTAFMPDGTETTWGSGGGTGFSGIVDTYADLPDPTLHSGELFYVTTTDGSGLGNVWQSDGTSWISALTPLQTQVDNDTTRITALEGHIRKVLYYEVISGANGTISPPSGATLNADEFAPNGNAILSEVDLSNKVTFVSPRDTFGTVVTTTLNVVNGNWVASGTPTVPTFAIIYSFNIAEVNWANVNQAFVLETERIAPTYSFSTGLTKSAFDIVTANLSTGIAGGQSAIGGTAASENLTLSSTVHATKGLIKFGTTSAYDEANTRLGIGTIAPGELLSLGSAGTLAGVISLAGSTSGKVIIQTAAIAGSTTLTLPVGYATGNGYVITSTTAGVLSWTAQSALGLTIGTTPISNGTTTRILYDNAGVLGEYTITGTGTIVAMQTSPTFITPTLGVATTTSINKLIITPPTTSATLRIDDGKQLWVSGSTTIDNTTIGFGTAGAISVVTGLDLIFNGGFSANLTFTALTNVIFPTSGTLATRATAEAFTNKTGYNGLVITANTGVITTGTWSATAIAETKGGTNQTTYATGDTLYASAANTLSKRTIGSTGDVYTVAGGIPIWAAPATSGTVTSVSGTANRITVATGTTTPVIDISASYVGQSSITTLGTITTGVWTGTVIAATSGGTAQTTYATGDILYASAANTLSKLAAGSNTQVLTLAAGIPSWASPTTGTVTSVSGTSNRITVATGTTTPVIDISASYVGQSSITTLGTIATGVWNGTVVGATYGGTGVNNGAFTITLAGSLVTVGAFTTTLTTTGTTGVTLPTTGTLATLAGSESFTNKTITSSTNVLGGVTMTLGSDATGDVYYRAAGGALTRLGVGANGTVLTLAGGLPSWAAGGGGSGTVTQVTWVTSQGVSASIATPTTTPDITVTLGALTGVTSVNGLVVTANTGAITTGTWSATAIGVTKGGTALTSIAQGDIIYGSSTSAFTALAKNTSSTRYLSNTGASNNPAWAQIALTTGVTGTLPVANGGTGITSLGTGVATWLGTPSSANLAAAITDETGSGALVFGTLPTLDRVTINLSGSTPALILAAGTATASQLRFTTGSENNSPTNGDMMYNGTNLVFYDNSSVKSLLMARGTVSAPSTSVGIGIVNYYGTSATNFLGDPSGWLSVVVTGTTYKIPVY